MIMSNAKTQELHDRLVVAPKLNGWEQKFHEALESYRARNDVELVTLDWKSLHCVSFTFELVEVQIGINAYKELVPSGVTGPRDAYRTLQKLSHGSLDHILGSLFEVRRKSYVQKGDIVLVPSSAETPGMDFACAVADPPFFWTVSTIGLVRGSIQDIVKAYKIGL